MIAEDVVFYFEMARHPEVGATHLLPFVEDIVHEEQPYTFFYAPQEVHAWSPRLQNVIFQRVHPLANSLPWYFQRSAPDLD